MEQELFLLFSGQMSSERSVKACEMNIQICDSDFGQLESQEEVRGGISLFETEKVTRG